ncbi:MAG: phenylacetate--CoA ligase family protein [bacterium]|jgi:phenylacetate-CoA ligase
MPVFGHIAELDRLARAPVEEMNDAVKCKLERALSHAASSVPYFRGKGYEGIDDFPVLTKRDIWDNYDLMRADTAKSDEGTEIFTSGSTGRRLKVLFDSLERRWRIALAWYGRSVPGNPGESNIPLCSGTASLWGASELKTGGIYKLRRRMRDALLRQKIFGCYLFPKEDAIRIHREIEALAPDVVMGYVTNLKLFARYSLELGLKKIRAKKVVPTAEALDAASRDEISSFFDAPIRERYGCREAGGIAFQCEHGAWHVFSPHVFPEVLRDDGKIARSGEGRLLLTKLNNRIMPLVRYDVEDRVELCLPGEVECECGRSYPVMRKLIGRDVDSIRFSDGSTLHGLCVAESLRGLPAEEFVFVQESETLCRFYIVPRPEFTDDCLRKALVKLETWIKGRVNVVPELVDEIPRALSDPSGTGKRRQVINLCDENRKARARSRPENMKVS